MLRSVFVTYEEAQKLRPIFQIFKKYGHLKEIREASSRILGELEYVRDIDPSPLRGHQLRLKEEDAETILEALRQLEEEGKL